MRDSALSTLVLYADYTTRLSYYDDWLDAFHQSPDCAVTAINICRSDKAAELKQAVKQADLIVLLHSTNGDTTLYLDPIAPILAERSGRLLSFIGNEVNLPGSPISAKRETLAILRPDWIATQLMLEAGEYLWGDLATQQVVALPHALNPAAFRPEKPDRQRGIDIGVRAVKYLAHLGDEDRNQLHDLFARHDFAPDLVVDISTKRLDRQGWAAFLNDCKATVSSEAGSWFIERDDATMNAIRAWVAEQNKGKSVVIANDSPLRRLGHRLPWWMRAALRQILSKGPLRHESTLNEDVPFDEVYDRFFKHRPRPPVYGKCISSRHFDAIGTGTCQILLEGRYNDILKPNDHYLSLKADHSNLPEILAQFRDPALRQKIASQALDHILAHHTYAHRVAEIVKLMG